MMTKYIWRQIKLNPQKHHQSSTTMRWRKRDGCKWERWMWPSLLTRLGCQTQVCFWWWGLAAAWLGGREGGRRGRGGGKGSERGWWAGGWQQVLAKYWPASRISHIHTLMSVTTAPSEHVYVCSNGNGSVLPESENKIFWMCDLFCFGWGVFEVLQMGEEQKKQAWKAYGTQRNANT